MLSHYCYYNIPYPHGPHHLSRKGNPSMKRRLFILATSLLALALGLRFLPQPAAMAQAVNHYVAATFHPSATAAGLAVECTTLPSSPANGAVACDSGASNVVKVYSNGSWVTVGSGSSATAGSGLLNSSGTWSFNPLDPSIIYLVEEFNSGAANTYTNSSGIISFNMQPVVGSGTFTGFAPGSDITAIGGVNLNTAATSNSANEISAIINAQNGSPNPWHVMNSGTWKATYRFKLSQVGNQTFMVGWDNAGVAAPGTTSSLYVEGTSASSDTNFFFKNCNSTTCSTRVDSGVAIDTNWHVLTTGRDGTNMYICLDACASPTTISTNVPASVMAPKFYIKTDNSTAMTLTADYFRYLQTGITPY